MDDIKTKFLDIINKKNRHVKIPAMGFSDYFVQNVSNSSSLVSSASTPRSTNSSLLNLSEQSESNLPDQEIYNTIENIYFQDDIDIEAYELNKFNDQDLDVEKLQKTIQILKKQQKVISKKVLQNILEQKSACTIEFTKINETEKILDESLKICQNARSNLAYAKKNLTTTNLEILASYKKRETLKCLLETLNVIKKMISTDQLLQNLLAEGDYTGAITILLESRNSALENSQYKCVEILSQKLQDTMIYTESELDRVLYEMTFKFDMKKYSKLHEAYKILGKTLIALDQLNMNFRKAIQTKALEEVRKYSEHNIDDKQKVLFEEICQNVPSKKYFECLQDLCKSFWEILVSYYQVARFHHHVSLFPKETNINNNHQQSREQLLQQEQDKQFELLISELLPQDGVQNESMEQTEKINVIESSTEQIYDQNLEKAQEIQSIEQEKQVDEESTLQQDCKSITSTNAISINIHSDEYLQDKIKNEQLNIWNDIQSKICVYLSSEKLQKLNFENFLQYLLIVQRLKKVGMEFCGEISTNLMECMREQTIAFFKRYHRMCLEEICLFLDNEEWELVTSFSNVTQLQEFQSIKNSLQRHHLQSIVTTITTTATTVVTSSPLPITSQITQSNLINKRNSSAGGGIIDNDNISSHSQDGNSSIYGVSSYFLKFPEKGSPFDGGFEKNMLKEDILSGIADESSCYFFGESEEERYGSNMDSNGDANDDEDDDNDSGTLLQNTLVKDDCNENNSLIVSNSSLNVLRCIGRYLQMCRLLHSISPEIINSMTELIDFYIFAVHDIFGKDLPVPSDNLYTNLLVKNLTRISLEIVPKVKNWPPTFSTIQTELCNPETMYGLKQRCVGVESCITIVEQFLQLRGYLEHLLQSTERLSLDNFYNETTNYIQDLRKPVYMCVSARIIDLQNILTGIGKVKWDINHINVQHSNYVDTLNRGVQTFAMQLEKITINMQIPRAAIWDSFTHVLTHTIVEGYANVKKCTAAGRALMQLDFTNFMSILELISHSKHPVHREYVDMYIKAYYMQKDMLQEFIINENCKKKYSAKQLITLVTCICANDRKTRQQLLNLIDTGHNNSFDNMITIHKRSPSISSISSP